MPVVDFRQWEAHIPGNQGTPWEGGVYTLSIVCSCGFPDFIPHMRFLRPLIHPNVYPTGTYAYYNSDFVSPTGRFEVSKRQWINTRHEDPERMAKLLQDVQKIIHHPNLEQPHQYDAYIVAKNNPKAYEERIRLQAAAWKPDPKTGLAGRPILQPTK
ncbi:ubiquitin-conjugating enzyme/RWD-like protein [Mycena filopes]|nr:ubiquitin-conjugating enzyme/RWD-like protein [Mycena filopes]